MKKKFKPSTALYDSNFEEHFHNVWRNHSTYPIVFHHTVHLPTNDPRKPIRKWELDFCFPQERVAIELQGFGTGHTSYLGMKRDYTKHNDLILSNWIVLYFMSVDIKDEPTTTVETICRILEGRNPEFRHSNHRPQRSFETRPDTLAEAARRLRNKRLN